MTPYENYARYDEYANVNLLYSGDNGDDTKICASGISKKNYILAIKSMK